ncbi:hypothetical protein FB45DRAFT_1024242 [Roridomyces roridus]|uniref:Bacteriophage T5 Orf172 DNA-binding domain-containing protein n=1 Tax=Roridomyces roridus TaxID=1738132 RepID=A0AAD7C634_9AGAR|nr:hypothetical protein FB45DRAFT_1024242 [Roridomyces roridus]
MALFTSDEIERIFASPLSDFEVAGYVYGFKHENTSGKAPGKDVIKVGSTKHIDDRPGQWDRQCEPHPHDWRWAYETATCRRLEKLVHMTLKLRGYHSKPHLCPGRTCGRKHRENFRDDLMERGEEEVEEVIQYWQACLGQASMRGLDMYMLYEHCAQKRGESPLIIGPRALAINLIVVGVAGFAVYSIVLSPLESQVYVPTLAGTQLGRQKTTSNQVILSGSLRYMIENTLLSQPLPPGKTNDSSSFITVFPTVTTLDGYEKHDCDSLLLNETVFALKAFIPVPKFLKAFT